MNDNEFWRARPKDWVKRFSDGNKIQIIATGHPVLQIKSLRCSPTNEISEMQSCMFSPIRRRLEIGLFMLICTQHDRDQIRAIAGKMCALKHGIE